MANLTKTTTSFEDILLNWVFDDVDDWHDGLISATAQQFIDSCYEESRQLLEDAGVENIPSSKQAVIEKAHNDGLLQDAATRAANAPASPGTEE